MSTRKPNAANDSRRQDRQGRQVRGLWSERLAVAMLMAKGYRILDRRWRGRGGELDIVAVRGKRIAFVEVKSRATTSDDDAHSAVGYRQAGHLQSAADQWLNRNRSYRDHEIGFDLVIVAPGHWPRHIKNGL